MRIDIEPCASDRLYIVDHMGVIMLHLEQDSLFPI